MSAAGPPSNDAVVLQRNGAIVTLTLNKPETRNPATGPEVLQRIERRNRVRRRSAAPRIGVPGSRHVVRMPADVAFVLERFRRYHEDRASGDC